MGALVMSAEILDLTPLGIFDRESQTFSYLTKERSGGVKILPLCISVLEPSEPVRGFKDTTAQGQNGMYTLLEG